MLKVPYVSYLRVYEPLAAFPEPERSHWARYARRTDLPDEQAELRGALTALVTAPNRPVPESESEDAFVTTAGGVVCVCPWRTRLRSWEALEEIGHWMMPADVLEQAAPEAGRRRAASRYARWLGENPDARPWIRSALWHVPIRWFVLFAEEERQRVAPGHPDAEYPSGGGGGSLRYRTPMSQARRRVARGLRTLRAAAPDGPLTPALVEVGRWLEEFHPRSLVELDYGGLVHTISAEQLAADHSARDVGAALAALSVRDLERAAELYEKVATRWMSVRERQFAN